MRVSWMCDMKMIFSLILLQTGSSPWESAVQQLQTAFAVQGAHKTGATENGHFCKSRLAHPTAQFWNLDESQWRRPQDNPRAAAPRNLQSHSRHLHTSGYAGEAGRSSKSREADHGRQSRIETHRANHPIAYWTQTDSKGPIPVNLLECWRPRRDLNPCYRRERALTDWIRL
jgi:hypothetical protein